MSNKTDVRNSYINENFNEEPNPVKNYKSREMNRSYQVNTTNIDESDTRANAGTGGFNGATSTTHLYADESRKSNFGRYFGVIFLIGLVLISFAFLTFAIFYDEIIDNDDETADQYWKRIRNEIKLRENKNRINGTQNENFISIINDSKPPTKPGITFENFVHGDFNSHGFEGKWLSSTELLHYDSESNLCITNATDWTKNVLISSQLIVKYRLSGLRLSADRKYFLANYNDLKVFRYSSISKYRVFSLNESQLSNALAPLDNPKDFYLNYAEFGPIGSQILFIHKNDIYYKSSADSKPIRLTNSGKLMSVYNGVPDWVYEEEIINAPTTFWFSPDGQGLVFSTINDTEVYIMSWPIYGTLRKVDGSYFQYPRSQSIRYPKPGGTNPTVSLYYISLRGYLTQTNSTNSSQYYMSYDLTPVHLLPPKDILDLGDHYFTTFKWIDNNWFVINWLNRAQNFSVLTKYSSENKFIPISSFKLQSSNGWIDVLKPPLITPDKSSYLIIVPKMSDKKKEVFMHIARVSVISSNSEFLTSGAFEVKEILDINKDMKRLYFIAAFPSNPGSKYLMSVSLNKSMEKSEPICHTCLMNTYMDNKDKNCLTSGAQFSKGAEYYIFNCDGPNIPRFEVRKTMDDSLVYTLEDNSGLKEKLVDLALPKQIILKVPVNGIDIDVMLTVPEGFEENSTTKYPLVFNVYGGPGSETGAVTQKYSFDEFGSYLVSNKSVIYVDLDARGSPNHGCKFMFDIYRRMGSVEVEDTIAVARYLRDNKPYVDRKAISIWGWSYGGYVTTLALENDYNDTVFNCGIAVAPVSDWMYYDSVYVERYMGFPIPEDNLQNYVKSSTLDKVKHINGKEFLVMFGTADDNVHTMNSMMLLKAMNEANIKYQTQIYPDNNHSMLGSRVHLYRRLVDFLERNCFNRK